MTLFVANLKYFTTDEDLKEWFNEHGYFPTRVKIVRHKESEESRGFAFAEFGSDEAAAREAIEELSGKQLHGRKITVRVAEQRPKSK